MKLPYYFAHRTLLTADSTISHCPLAYSVSFHSFRPQKGVFYSDMVKIASFPGHVGGEKAAWYCLRVHPQPLSEYLHKIARFTLPCSWKQTLNSVCE